MHFITHVNIHRHPERRWWSDDFLGLVHSFLLLQTNHTIPSYHNIPSFHAIPSYNTILSYNTTHNTLHYLLSAPDPTNACPTLPQPLLQQPIGWSRLSEHLYFFFPTALPQNYNQFLWNWAMCYESMPIVVNKARNDPYHHMTTMCFRSCSEREL